MTPHRCTSIPNQMKDLGNIRSLPATLHIIYCYESRIFFKCHTFRDIDLRFTAVLGNNISFYFMKRIRLQKKQIISEIMIKRNDFGYFILKYGGSHILLENANICKYNNPYTISKRYIMTHRYIILIYGFANEQLDILHTELIFSEHQTKHCSKHITLIKISIIWIFCNRILQHTCCALWLH